MATKTPLSLLSSWFLGIDVVGARDDSWGGHCLALHHLAVKLSHVGADVDGLSYRPHWSTDYD
jgi:hypothetical protein